MLDDILLFVRVVKAGSLLAVSRKTDTPQSTLSRRIKNLEEELGITLFDRHARGLELTQIGAQLFANFQDYGSNLKQRVMALKESSKKATGKLQVLLPFAFAETLVLPYLGQFALDNPELELSIYYRFSEFNMHKEQLDIAVTFELPRQQTQKVKILASDQVILIAAKDYLAIHPPIKQLSDLEQPEHRWVGRVFSTAAPALLRFYSQDHIVYLPNQMQLRINTFWLATYLAKLGYGICAAPRHLVKQELEEGSLIHILPNYHLGIYNYYIMRNIEAHDQRYVVFLEFIKHCMERALPIYEDGLDFKQQFVA